MTVPRDRLLPRPPALMFGVPVANVTIDETVQLIDELVEEGRRFGRTHQISTVNVDFLVNGLHEPDVREILQRATLCLADGMPVVWAARRLGMPIRERVAGADLVPLLVEASASNGQHVHIFGSQPEVAAAARAMLAARYPGARFSIDPGPFIRDVLDVGDDVIDSIRAVDADILCVALGNPKQERFIAAHANRLGVPVMIGVGGSLDMLVGARRRAPTWMQRGGLEWFWRAGQEPKRLGPRYARDARVFGPALLGELRRQRQRSHGRGLRMSISEGDVRIDVVGDHLLPSADWDRASRLLLGGSRLRIFGSSDSPPTDLAAAQLVGLVAQHRRGAVWAPATDETLAAAWAAALGCTAQLLR